MMNIVFDAETKEAIAYAAELISSAGAILISASAGMGVDSGLPDFRGEGGFWRAYPALRENGVGFKDIASAAMFADDPRLAWGFYGHRLALYRRTEPHAGFALLKRWVDAKRGGYSIYTSNVDGQFTRAGFPSERIHECHGSIQLLQCTRPCSGEAWAADGLKVEIDERTCTWTGPLPACIHCGALARPNIAMFNDGAWDGASSSCASERQQAWLAGAKSPLVIEIGAGTEANSVRGFSEASVHSRRGHLIRINPEGDPGKVADVALAMPALQALCAIDQHLTWAPAAGGKQASEQTFQRRLALLALLPGEDSGGIGAGVLTQRLNDAQYACVRRTVERDLQALHAAPELPALGFEVIHAADPRHAHGRLWSRTTRSRQVSGLPGALGT